MHRRSQKIQLLTYCLQNKTIVALSKELTAQGLYFSATASENKRTAKQDAQGTMAIPLAAPLHFHQYPKSIKKK